MGNELKQKILEYNGIISQQELKTKPSILNCPRCNLVNAIENKYCSKCSYPLVPSAFEEIKMAEDMKINALMNKHEQEMRVLRQDMEDKFNQIFAKIDIKKLR